MPGSRDDVGDQQDLPAMRPKKYADLERLCRHLLEAKSIEKNAKANTKEKADQVASALKGHNETAYGFTEDGVRYVVTLEDKEAVKVVASGPKKKKPRD